MKEIFENLNATGNVSEVQLASEEDMAKSTQAILWFLKCSGNAPSEFTVLCGGHSNGGASVADGRRLLNMRYMNHINLTLDDDKIKASGDNNGDVGSVIVGAGATAGRAVAVTYSQSHGYSQYATLPVGQKPSVGISGLTLGGGFGFLTRYSGLLCDRLKSLTAIVPTTPDGVPKKVTPDNEYADLFWASCGGGGGNFAVVTEFEFNPVPIYCTHANGTDDYDGCKVLKLELSLPVSSELVSFYQDWSLSMSTRITPNLEVENATHVKFAGIFLGDEEMWEDAVDRSLANATTPISSTDLKNSISRQDLAEASVDLTGWTPDGSPLQLLSSFREQRTYFIYKSYWLHEPLPEEAIEILINESMEFEGKSFIVFEYQALGGDPGADDLEDDGSYPEWSPQNRFAAVPPKDTAFAHRGAKHCLMFKVQAEDEINGDKYLRQMNRVFDKIGSFVKGQSTYYNHVDMTLPPEIPYFRNGVELNPRVTEDDKDYWLDRLREVRAKYNPLGMMVNSGGVGMPLEGSDESSNGSDEPSTGSDEPSDGSDEGADNADSSSSYFARKATAATALYAIVAICFCSWF